MKKRNQIFKKIGAVLCAMIVSFGICDAYYADDVYTVSPFYDESAESLFNNRNYYTVFRYMGRDIVLCYNGYSYKSFSWGLEINCSKVGVLSLNGGSWDDVKSGSGDGLMGTVAYSYFTDLDPSINSTNILSHILYSSIEIKDSSGNVLCPVGYNPNFVFDETYNSSVGYLQNVSRKSTYIRDELYNYDDDSLTYHWYHDLTSTGGVDLSSGDYNIRHYISNAKVKGYDKTDIVEMSEKYLMNEYDASKGYFSYLQKDYLEKLETLGYEEIDFIDKYLKGYFTLQHHYFQIVNTSTNEVGGYLHFYPKDASGENFGVELVYEGLDLNDEIDPYAPNGFIDTDVGSGTTIEDALENADAPKLDDLGGIDPLIENLEGYASQITNVTNGIGALLGSLPPWFVGLLGLSFGLFFVLVAVKVLRG